VSVLLALMSSVLWGVSDYVGGVASKRLPALSVVGGSQAVALGLLIPVAVVVGTSGPLWPGITAGIVGVVGLGAFYAALAQGTMGVIAPIAALGALIPVGVGLARGDEPSNLQLVGIAIAIVGVVLASGPELSGGAPVRPLLLAVVAAVGFGFVAVLIAEGSDGPGEEAVLLLLLMRATSVSLLALLFLAARARGTGSGLRRKDLAVLVLIGLADLGANAAFAAAARGSLLSVTSVLASLYPVVTVLLARQFQHEVLRPIQVVGAAATLGGVALLAVG
jgi:drug/metabolite transporter (DMT)-like permease